MFSVTCSFMLSCRSFSSLSPRSSFVQPEYEVDRSTKLTEKEVTEVEKHAKQMLPMLQQQMQAFEEELKKR